MTHTALITGSTSGIGRATAEALAKFGWQVIVHGRSIDTCRQTVQDLKAATQSTTIDFIAADLSDLRAIRSMAAEVQERFPALHILILNAGTFSNSRILSPDQLERTWVVNYLSRFLLTNLLLDTLKYNAPSRIVDISGAYHAKGQIHFEDINLAEGYSMSAANNQSKLANVLFTYKLARELEGTAVTINTLHPGAVNTGSVLKTAGFSPFFRVFYRLMSPFFKDPGKGAATSVFLAAAPEVDGISGKYFVNKQARKSGALTYDEALQERLWAVSNELVGAHF
ncbi:MAG: SDR family NAD(P)-dependent oxidoreductase [Phaeodactylibacter sp.]|nr:SDR family NAD(P)-dependent oxidoreductase [Phaeodactylibacter sp.]